MKSTENHKKDRTTRKYSKTERQWSKLRKNLHLQPQFFRGEEAEASTPW
jgi:hypothetical protein